MISTYKKEDNASNFILSKRIIQSRNPSNQHLCIPPIREFNIAERALIKLFLMAKAVSEVHKSPYEIYALCIGKDLTIEDIYIPYQNVTYVSIHIDGDMIYHARQEIRAQKFNIIGWAHSHADFSVFSSGTDNENHKTVLHETSNYSEKEGIRLKYMVAMTVNMKENVYGVTLTHYPCGIITQSEASVRVIRDSDDITPEWIYYQYIKLKNIVKERVKTSGYYRSEYTHDSYQSTRPSPSSDYTIEDVISFSSLFENSSKIPKLLQHELKPIYEAGYLSRFERSTMNFAEIKPEVKKEVIEHKNIKLSEKSKPLEKTQTDEIVNKEQNKEFIIRKSSSGTKIYQQNTPTKVYNIYDIDSKKYSVDANGFKSLESAVPAEKGSEVSVSVDPTPLESVVPAEKGSEVSVSVDPTPSESAVPAEKGSEVSVSVDSTPSESAVPAEKAMDSNFEEKNKALNHSHSINNIESIEINDPISLTEAELSHFETEFVKIRAEMLRAKFGIGEKNLHKILSAFSKRFKIN